MESQRQGALILAGVSALAGALVGIGIPKDSVVHYEATVKAHQFLVLAHGSPDEIDRAKTILEAATPSELTLHTNTRAGAAGREAHQHHATDLATED